MTVSTNLVLCMKKLKSMELAQGEIAVGQGKNRGDNLGGDPLPAFVLIPKANKTSESVSI